MYFLDSEYNLPESKLSTGLLNDGYTGTCPSHLTDRN